MKTAIVSGAVLLALAIIAAAARPQETVKRERRVEVQIPVEIPVVVERRTVEPSGAELRSDPQIREGQANVRMLFLFERELSLSDEQVLHIERVLKDREVEIEDYHRQLRESRIFVAREYSARIRRIQRDSYDRIGTVLDSAQYRRFVRLLEEGRVGDGVAFTIEPGMVVLD